jgi:glutamate carboxypeptidase
MSIDYRKIGQQIQDYLQQQRQEMVDFITLLVANESPSSVPETQGKIFSILADALQRQNYRTKFVQGKKTGGGLLAIPSDRFPNQPNQMLLGHTDTVWPLNSLTRMPVHIKSGKLFGPGVYDMKAGIMFMIFALKALNDQGLKPAVAPLIFLNSDEEIGSHESRQHILRLARCVDRTLVLEPSLGREGKLKTRRKGVAEFTIHVVGKASHAGLAPEKGISAILELSHLIQELFALNDPAKGITVNVGNIDGGIRPNVVAPQSKAIVDVRVLHLEDAKYIEDTIRNLKPVNNKAKLIIEGGFERPPLEKTAQNQKLWQRAKEIAAESGIELEEATAGGGSDGNYTSLYTATLDGLGAVGDNAHALGEFIYLDSMIERVSFLAQLLMSPPLV